MSAIDEFKANFRVLAELREERDRTKKEADAAEKEYRAKESELYAELEEGGIRGRQEFDFGGDLGTIKFQRRSTIYGRVENKETARKAIQAMGLDEELLTPTVALGRLNERVRDWLESGQELPEGIGFYTRDGISISRK